MWMNAVVATSFLFIFLSTAEFIYAKSSTALSPTSAVTLVGSQVTLPTADVNDDKLHRYGVHLDDGKGGNVEVRFLLFKKPDGNIVSVADACQICGPVGFYIGDQGITCKMCASPLNAASMGQKGGCNPIPLKSTISGGQLIIQAADLRELAPVFETINAPASNDRTRKHRVAHPFRSHRKGWVIVRSTTALPSDPQIPPLFPNPKLSS